MNKAVLYVRENEQTHRMTMVHCYDQESAVPLDLARKVALLDAIYPKLRIDLLTVRGPFGPDMIRWLASYLNIPTNMVPWPAVLPLCSQLALIPPPPPLFLSLLLDVHCLP